jgi:Tol biopolymer transport system component
MVVGEPDPATALDIWLLPTNAQEEPVPYARMPYAEHAARLSPDGDLIAYASTESGSFEIWVDTFPQSSHKTRVSSSGGHHPCWSNNGRGLYYLAPGNGTLMKASVARYGDRLQVSDAEPLFRLENKLANVSDIARWPYDVLGGGENIIFNLEVEDSTSTDITVGLNWPASLKR